jgi:CheY-like chemotaxis protein
MLNSWGSRSAAVDSVGRALDILRWSAVMEMPFCAVLLDAAAVPDGLRPTIERVRGEGSARRAAILVMSDNDCGDLDESCEIAACLHKPVSQSRLLETLARAINQRSEVDNRYRPTPMGSSPATPHSLRILLAEDVPENQELAVELLEQWGHSVAVASNGLEVVERFSNEPFDLVLMDIQMTGMSGLEALAAIREREKLTGTHTPVIAVTAHAMKGDRERYLEAGMDGYVSKPIRAQELSDAISQAAAAQKVT